MKNMKLVDTHCHLDFKDYKEDLEAVIERAVSDGVVRMVAPGINLKSSEECIKLSKKFPEVFAAVGIHPHDADVYSSTDIDALRNIALMEEKVVAVGEIGLDLYRKYADFENQKKLFRECLDLAAELDLPVIVHNRKTEKEILEMLREKNTYVLRGVMHCFSGNEDFLKEVLGLDLYVSFAGNITFDKADDLRNIAKCVPVEKLLLETDSPYITPQPLRGKRNEPANIKYLIDVYSQIYGMKKEDIARITTENANELFRLGLQKKSTIVYPIRDSLYINVTYRCTNRCSFCTRSSSDFVKGYDLKLDHEPLSEEIISSIDDPSKYDEVVFCGLGEPTLRMGLILKVARFVKDRGGRVRVITNGEAELIAGGGAVISKMKGFVDKVSVSINAGDAESYQHLCVSVFGERSYESILKFVKECRQNGIEVELTCLDFVGEEVISRIKEFAGEIGAEFRLRHFNVVG